jgi:hypothetical protein
LPGRQPRPRPPLDERLEDATRLVQAIPSEQQFLDPLTVSAPLLNLVEVAAVGIEWVVGFFGGRRKSPATKRSNTDV